MKPLLEAKNFHLTKYGVNGDKDTKLAFDEWRDDIEEYLNTYLSMIKEMIQNAAGHSETIDQDNVSDVCVSAGVAEHYLSWTFAGVNDEIYTLVNTYLGGKTKKAFMTSSTRGFKFTVRW